MISLHSARRTKMTTLNLHAKVEAEYNAPSTHCSRVVIFVLRVEQAIKVNKSEDFSRRKKLSHMHHSYNNKEITCYNIISSVAMCLSYVSRALFAFLFWSACL